MGANSDPATRTSPSWAGVISKAMSLPRLSTTAWIFVVALHSCFLERPVHSFDLAVRPRMVRLCESVLDAALPASAIERMTAPHCGGLRTILCQVSELNAVVGKHGMDLVGNGFDQRLQEVRGHAHGGFLVQLDEGELGGPVDRHEQVEPAFLGTDLGNVDVEVADRISLELALVRLVALHLWQAGDAVAL
jgi:hypothetical protein